MKYIVFNIISSNFSSGLYNRLDKHINTINIKII